MRVQEESLVLFRCNEFLFQYVFSVKQFGFVDSQVDSCKSVAPGLKKNWMEKSNGIFVLYNVYIIQSKS